MIALIMEREFHEAEEERWNALWVAEWNPVPQAVRKAALVGGYQDSFIRQSKAMQSFINQHEEFTTDTPLNTGH